MDHTAAKGGFLDPSQAGIEETAMAPETEARLAEITEQARIGLAAGREIVVVALTSRHAEYLRDRAANHGETSERHLETILRNFRSYYDDRRPEHHVAEPERGMPAATRRA